MASGDTKTESYLRAAAEGTRADLPSDNCCNTKTQNLIVGVANRIMDVEDEVEELKNNPDVVDIVDTYQDLQDYDTSTLTDKDIIRVLQDNTHSGNSTYYRWNATTNQFDFVGEVAGGSGDTVYSGKTTSSSATGGAVYIGNLNTSQEEQDDPTTTDNYWRYFWALPNDNTLTPTNNSMNILGDIKSSAYNSIALLKGATVYGGRGIAIGGDAQSGQSSVALGNSANAGTIGFNRSGMIAIGASAYADVDKAICIGGGGSNYGVLNSASTSSVALGYKASVGNGATGYKNSVALGAYSRATRQGEVNVGLVTDETTGGYNDTAYRVIGGVHDPVDAHDAATKGYVDSQGGGGGDIVYSTKTTSNGADGGAVYIGGKNASQEIYPDPTTTDNHWNYFWALPFNASETGYTYTPGNKTINIGGMQMGSGNEQNVTLGYRSQSLGSHNVNIGFQAGSTVANGSCVCVGDTAQCFQNYGVALGRSAQVNQGHIGSVALGYDSRTTRQGEVYIGPNSTFAGYNSTKYRVLGGVYDGQDAHDAVTVGQVNALIDAINSALNTNIAHIGS